MFMWSLETFSSHSTKAYNCHFYIMGSLKSRISTVTQLQNLWPCSIHLLTLYNSWMHFTQHWIPSTFNCLHRTTHGIFQTIYYISHFTQQYLLILLLSFHKFPLSFLPLLSLSAHVLLQITSLTVS